MFLRDMLRDEEANLSIDRLVGPLLDAESLAAEIAEPLRESAPIQFSTALERCAPEGTCQGYHAVWQYLRFANLARSVRVDGPLYKAVAERMARAGRLHRVLITATADYSMLAHLSHGARKGGAEPTFDVVDLCATSLRMNEWYGAKKNLRVRTVLGDVLQYSGDGSYDLICSHSFVHWLPVADRPRLFACWQRNLAPEGRVCFSNRTWTDHLEFAPDEMERRVNKLADTTVERLAELGIPLPCERDRFLDLLRAYGHRRDHLDPLPMADLERWIVDAGLAIEIGLPAAHFVPENYDRIVGPFSVNRGPRMWFQLRRA